MNKSTIRVITVIGVVLLLSGCNKKESHFEDGGNLLCTDSNLFSDDVIIIVNSDNSYLGRRHKAHGDVEITVTMNGGHMFNHTSFDIDNCEIR